MERALCLVCLCLVFVRKPRVPYLCFWCPRTTKRAFREKWTEKERNARAPGRRRNRSYTSFRRVMPGVYPLSERKIKYIGGGGGGQGRPHVCAVHNNRRAYALLLLFVNCTSESMGIRCSSDPWKTCLEIRWKSDEKLMSYNYRRKRFLTPSQKNRTTIKTALKIYGLHSVTKHRHFSNRVPHNPTVPRRSVSKATKNLRRKVTFKKDQQQIHSRLDCF